MRASRLVLAALVATALVGCSDDDREGFRSQSASSSAEVSAAHNAVDVQFVQDMTPHHEGAVEMAELAGSRADDERVQALAARILEAQQPEISLMAAMAKAWDAALTGGGHSAHGGDEDAEALEPLSGRAFDRAFLTRMIAHHESALPMAKTVLSKGENPQVKQLAQDILRTQEAEITEMARLLPQL